MTDATEQPDAKGQGSGRKKRKKKPNGLSPGARANAKAGQQAPRQIAGIRLSPRALQDAVNILKKQPWDEVADVMPQLIAAQPIYVDEMKSESE